MEWQTVEKHIPYKVCDYMMYYITCCVHYKLHIPPHTCCTGQATSLPTQYMYSKCPYFHVGFNFWCAFLFYKMKHNFTDTKNSKFLMISWESQILAILNAHKMFKKTKWELLGSQKFKTFSVYFLPIFQIIAVKNEVKWISVCHV
jgi:hypothetical protein